jgi:hypothetical protein
VRLFKLPDQVVRLAILFAVALTLLFFVRRHFVPKTFGEFGHYRGAAVAEVAGLPLKYAGLQACIECHSDEGEIKSKSFHRGLSCEVCHGPSRDHAEDPGSRTPDIPRDRANCLHCHSYLSSRPTGFPQIIETLHNPMKPCVTCHNPHDPTPPQVPGACAACHASIVRTKSVSRHASVDCETCHQVAPEHRENPRAHLPTVPTSREFCGKCHAQDAASPPEIPRVDFASHGDRYLCWQCHYPHHPEGE